MHVSICIGHALTCQGHMLPIEATHLTDPICFKNVVHEPTYKTDVLTTR